ncbi:PDZ domain-containing RING finger protein 4-like [Acipenser oxyrinchus oxyrinchus]|uniref:PDZ domain-containing RING finger protein 4-like n=1 Tax=Acipenser oxyrinchus oxyrinchus TaxID=40147 RepID=A0AAD8FUU5_ACIOX|nr:PDZ domain-containing RING finger protein 4-like [Acipenser oxyrinchus oxyrinchus]
MGCQLSGLWLGLGLGPLSSRSSCCSAERPRPGTLSNEVRCADRVSGRVRGHMRTLQLLSVLIGLVMLSLTAPEEVKGTELSQASQREALQVLGNADEPITLQIDGRKPRPQGAQTLECSTQPERPRGSLRSLGVRMGGSSRPSPGNDSFRSCFNHCPSHDPVNGPDYLPSIPHDVENTERLKFQDPRLSGLMPEGKGFLTGCCRPSIEKAGCFLSQMEDEDAVFEKSPLSPPTLHELDSGLGCTDGSFHQGELSGLETEEGAEESGSSPLDRTSRDTRSSESLISSELSDSGFYSVSTGEFRRFHKVLEKKIRQYRAKTTPGRIPNHTAGKKDDLVSIPEALTCQRQEPQNKTAQNYSPGSMGCLRGASSVHYRKADSPCLSSYSSLSTALSPNTGTSSTCSSPYGPNQAVRLGGTPAELLRRNLQRGVQSVRGHQLTTQEVQHRSNREELPTRRSVMDCAGEHTKGHGDLVGSQWQQRTVADCREKLPTRESKVSNRCRLGKATAEVTERLEEPSPGAPARKQKHKSTSVCSQNLGIKASQELSLDCGHGSGPKPIRYCKQGNCQDPCSAREGEFAFLGCRKGAPNARVLRSKLLKARALRLADERGGGTTDEDARSEAKAGRYWSRADRRRHLASARQRRMSRCSENSKETRTAVLELSQRKLNRLHNKKVLDNWTTIHELLSHGSKASPGAEGQLCSTALLSVTTV